MRVNTYACQINDKPKGHVLPMQLLQCIADKQNILQVKEVLQNEHHPLD